MKTTIQIFECPMCERRGAIISVWEDELVPSKEELKGALHTCRSCNKGKWAIDEVEIREGDYEGI